MLSLVRVRSGAPLRRHPRPAPGVRPPHAGVGGRRGGRGGRRRPGGVRPAVSQGRGVPRSAIGALLALRCVAPARQQPSPRRAAGPDAPSGLVADRGARPRSAGRGSFGAGPRRRSGSHPRPGGDLGVLAGGAAGPAAPRGRRCARAQPQHHALSRAARPVASSSSAHARGRDPRHGLRPARQHLQHRAHGGGGVR